MAAFPSPSHPSIPPTIHWPALSPGAFDFVARMVAQIFAVPIGVVAVPQHPSGFCLNSIYGLEALGQPASDLEIRCQDLFRLGLNSPLRFAELSDQGLPLSFWASAPLLSRQGQPLGVLAIADTRPRALPDPQLVRLTELACLVGQDLEIQVTSWQQQASATVQSLSEDLDRKVRVRTAQLNKQVKALLVQARLLNTIPNPVFAMDAAGYILYWNAAAQHLFGIRPEQALGEVFEELIPFSAAQIPGVQAALQQGTLWSGEVELPNGQTTLLMTQSPTWEGSSQEEPLLTGAISISVDITERKQTEKALRDSEERFAKTFHVNPVAIAITTLPEGRILDVNQSFLDLFGYQRDALLDESLATLNIWMDPTQQDQLMRILPHNHPLRNLECKFRTYPGSILDVLLSLELIDIGVQSCALMMIFDITDRKRLEEQLLHDALHDALTGLPNRALFKERLDHALKRIRRYPQSQLSVLFIDLDRFKVVNDSLGHLAGDQLLVELAQRFTDSLRPGDTIARLGGDEFAVLLEEVTNPQTPAVIAGRLQQQLIHPFRLEDQDVFISASIGIVLYTPDIQTSEEMLRQADIAMYQAKGRGRARYALFTPDMRDLAVARLQLETNLRLAWERQELQVYYQPILELSTQTVVGFEALLRWHHPERGVISPGEFIPTSEEIGLIIPIGLWVCREACQQLRLWQTQFPHAERLSISVNLSCHQFTYTGLVADIASILAETQLDPAFLKLEITETILSDHAERVLGRLLQLREMGLHLSIDDFGTGYSSLSRLQSFPINILKIDRSFTARMATDPSSRTIVQAILWIAEAMHMEVIAEGIETSQQLEQLKNLRCQYGQGFLFSEALSSFAATHWLAQFSSSP